MEKIDDIEVYLTEFGLDNEEIKSIKFRNKYLKLTIKEEVVEIIDFLKKECKLNKQDVKRLIISNPFILTESMERINLLNNIYKNIGFKSKDYKQYLYVYDKAFSLNPRIVFEKIEKMVSCGKSKNDIKNSIIENSYSLFY